MEKLIVIAIILVASLVHNWIQRKQDEAAGEETPPPDRQRRPARPTPSAPTQGSGGWEEELKRLLQGETMAAPPERPVPPALPPVMRPAAPAPPPIPTPSAPRPFLARTAIPVPDEGREMEVGLPVRPVTLPQASLRQASSAHDRAQIHSDVAQRMQAAASRVAEHVGGTPEARRAERSADVRGLLRERESQRNVILASIILGPPRAVEPAR